MPPSCLALAPSLPTLTHSVLYAFSLSRLSLAHTLFPLAKPHPLKDRHITYIRHGCSLIQVGSSRNGSGSSSSDSATNANANAIAIAPVASAIPTAAATTTIIVSVVAHHHHRTTTTTSSSPVPINPFMLLFLLDSRLLLPYNSSPLVEEPRAALGLLGAGNGDGAVAAATAQGLGDAGAAAEGERSARSRAAEAARRADLGRLEALLDCSKLGREPAGC